MPPSSLSALALALSASAAAAQLTLSFNATRPLHTVDPRFVCFNIDTGSLYNGMNFSDTKLRALTAQLAPAIIRIGGTAVDSSFYFPDEPYNVGVPNVCDACGSGASAIGNDMLLHIVDYMQATNMSLLWDFNGQKTRTPEGAWDPSVNATALLTFLDSKFGGKIDYAYSVSNEPDLWKPTQYPASVLAQDELTLKDVLTRFSIGREVYGPSYARIDEAATTEFLGVAAKGGLHGYTIHNYPYGGHDCVVQNYLNKSKVTSDLAAKLGMVSTVAAATPGGKDVLLVLEETAGSSGGGCENVTDRFVAGFSWLLTLNTAASQLFSRVHRQDIAGWSFAFGASHYMLVGPSGWVNGSHDLLTPHPDWFTTILFKQLMGRNILSTSVGGGDEVLRHAFNANVWCASAVSPFGSTGVILSWQNLAGTDITLTLPPSLTSVRSSRFTLTATSSGTDVSSLDSDDIYLNGEILRVGDDGMLPVYPLPGAAFPAGAPLVALAYSYGFVAFDGSDGGAFPACGAAA